MTEETKTYAMSNLSGRGCVVRGMTDGLEALRQAVFLLLQTEAGRWPVYSGDYGVELAGFFGRPSAYVIPEAERRLLFCGEKHLWRIGAGNGGFVIKA